MQTSLLKDSCSETNRRDCRLPLQKCTSLELVSLVSQDGGILPGMMCSLNLGLRSPQVWHAFIHYSLVHAMISGLVVEGAMAQSTRSGLASGLCRPTIRHFFSWSRFCSISMCSIRSVFFCASASNKKTPAIFLIAVWLHHNQIHEFLIVS